MIDHHIRGDRSFFIIYSLRHETVEGTAVIFNLSEIKEAGNGIGYNQDSAMLGVI